MKINRTPITKISQSPAHKIKSFFIIMICVICVPSSFAQNKNTSANRTIDSLLTLLKTDKEDTNKVIHLHQLTNEYISIVDHTAGLNCGTKELELASKLNFKKGISQACYIIGSIYMQQGNNPKTLEYWLKALEVEKALKNKTGISKYLCDIGSIYSDQSDYPQALDYYFKALKIAEEIQDEDKIAITFGNVGVVYYKQGDYSKALEYYSKALKIEQKVNDKAGVSVALCDIGNVYYSRADYPNALDCYFKAIKMSEELGDKNGLARNLGNIGVIYNDQKEYSKALDYDFRALKMSEELKNENLMAAWYGNIGSLYIVTGKFKEAEKYLKKAVALEKSIGGFDYLREFEGNLSQLYDTIGQYKEALIHYKKAMALKDTIFSQENKKQLVRKEMNYEFDKKEAATKAEHDKEIAVEESEKKKQRFVLILVSFVLILVFLFAGFIFRSLRITRKQKRTIELQKEEVLVQKELVEKQKEKITDSITYAQRIQQSILMEESEIKNQLPECFIYFQPKDIVSGDFYWFSKVEGRSEIGEQRLENDSQLPTPDSKLIIAAVDCTGHGVPGAFMSMIGNTLLNQIVNEKHITTPSEILKHLNTGVYEALHQKKDGALSDDGMDISLCSIDYKNNEIQYAGAENPLYIVSNGEIEIIKANMLGIGGGGMRSKKTDPAKKEFTNHTIPLKKNMSIYLFTDGYMDQFGGLERKKFGTQKFKELLLNNQHLNMQKQKELIALAHTEWKGSTQQIDDICVIGIKI